MAVAIGGVELSAVAVLWVCIAMLVLLEVVVLGPIRILHSALGWVPFVGNIIATVERRVTNGLDAAIRGTEGAAVTLWHGVVWSFDESLLGLEYFTLKTVQALQYLRGTALPVFVHTVMRPLERAADAVAARVGQLEHDLPHEIGRVEVETTARTQAVLHEAQRDIAALHRTLDAELVERLDRLEATLRHEIAAGVTGAEAYAGHAIGVLQTAEAAAIGQAERVGELALDELRQLAGGLDWRTIATLLASIPLLHALISALEAETGLGRAECRAKVRGICSADPARWGRLLALLGFTVAWPGFGDLLEWVEHLAGDTIGAVVELAEH